MHDLVIRGGTIVDGSGREPVEADIAIDNGKITAIGAITGRGTEEIGARGKIVTPGFVDPHSHYDAQVTWSSHITPSSWQGVTTTLIGNCGVGFAPCDPENRPLLVRLMEGVEDIPEPILTEGLPWNWTSFPSYLDSLDARPFDLDVATQVPHAAIRVHVMGQRGVDREPATPEDAAAMAALVAEGIRAGALGFSTSRTINHKTKAGAHIPTLNAAEAELTAIARALPAGWLQVISDFDDAEPEFALLRRLSAAAGKPMTITILQRDNKPEEWRRICGWIAEAARTGPPIYGQVLTRPTGIILGLEISQNPFTGRPSYESIAGLPLAAKVTALRDPGLRAKILTEETADPSLRRRVSLWTRIFPMADPPSYEPTSEDSIAARAARMGRDPADLAYDLMLENGGKALFYRPLSNYTHGNLDAVHDMLCHEQTIVGLGDGGAHVGILSDASALTTMLTHWTRDRNGPKFSLSWAVKRITRDSALAIGLADRGLLAPGHKADVNIIDYDHLTLHAPQVVYDLPAGGRRLIQRAEGYDATIVSGAVVRRRGETTGALPGRLVRGMRAVP